MAATPVGEALKLIHGDKLPVLVDKVKAGKITRAALVEVDANRYNFTPLHHAAEKGNLELVDALLAAEVDVDHRDTGGCTPLQVAAGEGHLRVVERLVKAGAGVNVQDSQGHAALHYAVDNGHVNITMFLLRNGANPNLRDHEGCTPLHTAVDKGLPTITAELLAHNANIGVQDSDQWTAFHYIASAPLYRKSQGDITRMLINHAPALARTTLNLQDSTGCTPFHLAARLGRKALVDDLIRSGGNYRATCNKGMTPLDYALQSQQKAVIKSLMDIGAPHTLPLHSEDDNAQVSSGTKATDHDQRQSVDGHADDNVTQSMSAGKADKRKRKKHKPNKIPRSPSAEHSLGPIALTLEGGRATQHHSSQQPSNTPPRSPPKHATLVRSEEAIPPQPPAQASPLPNGAFPMAVTKAAPPAASATAQPHTTTPVSPPPQTKPIILPQSAAPPQPVVAMAVNSGPPVARMDHLEIKHNRLKLEILFDGAPVDELEVMMQVHKFVKSLSAPTS